MRFITAKVTRDTNHSHTGDFAPWEIPILQLIHDPGNVVESGETQVDFEIPEPADEWDRLAKRYGTDGETKIPYVAAAFGQGQNGLAALTAAIEKERVNSRELAGADPLAA